MAIRCGGTIATELQDFRNRRSYEAGRGWVTISSGVGTPAVVANAATLFQSYGYERIEIVPQDGTPFDRIEAVLTDDVTETSWELAGKQVDCDFLLYAHINGLLTDEDVNKIQKNLDSNTNTDGTLPSDLTTDRQKEFYRIGIRGEKTRTRHTQVLNLQQTNSTRASLNAALTNCDKVLLTTAQAVALGISNYDLQILEDIPSDIYAMMATDSLQVVSPRMVWGWLKYHPQLNRSSLGKWSRSQQWEYGLWAVNAYSFYPDLTAYIV